MGEPRRRPDREGLAAGSPRLLRRLGPALLVLALFVVAAAASLGRDDPVAGAVAPEPAAERSSPQSGPRLKARAEPGPKPAGDKAKDRCLAPRRVQKASKYAATRIGRVSFAVLDECGRLVGADRYDVHFSASVVKAMLLVAYLRQGSVKGRELDGGERALLGPMIKVSDNDSATTVYGIVGSEGLTDLAADAGMRSFTTMSIWGGSEITAGDQARFFKRIEQYVPERHEDYVLGLMARVVSSQRWGVARLELPGWKIYIKGGWSPESGSATWRVNQVALLRREGKGRRERRLSLAILTDGHASYGYGQDTIEGVAERLLEPYTADR